ncbi:MAG: hypothetical protein ACOYOS_19925 [Syntrophales bacterium]
MKYLYKLLGTRGGGTGTNDIMNLLIQHEYYRELLKDPNPGRMIEVDAEEAAQNDEKVYEDDEMWTKGW